MRPAFLPTPDMRAATLSAATARMWPLAAVTAAIALAVYLPTVARDLSWAGAAGDGGELITASFTLGVPHPPGYPTYVALGKLFSLLPLGTAAFRYNLFSAVGAAGAAGLLAAAIRAQWGERVGPLAAAVVALSFAFLPLVWSQAVVAEVYALNLLLVAALVLAWAGRAPAAVVGLLLGLAVTTHPTSLLLLPMALLGVGQDRARLLAGIVIGLTPLLLLPWLARGDSPVVWGQPDTLGGWWWLVSGRLYAANFSFPPDGQRVAALLRALALGPAALIAGRRAATGPLADVATQTVERDPRPLLLGATATLYALFALAYATQDAAVLLLPALLLLAVLLAPLVARLGQWSLALPLVLAVVGLAGRAGSAEPSPRALAAAAFDATPPHAVLLTPGDRSLFALWYFHHVEGARPDVVLVDANLFAFDWYRVRLARQQPRLFVPAADDLPAFARGNAAERPVCAVSLIGQPSPLPGAEPVVPALVGPPHVACIEVHK